MRDWNNVATLPWTWDGWCISSISLVEVLHKRRSLPYLECLRLLAATLPMRESRALRNAETSRRKNQPTHTYSHVCTACISCSGSQMMPALSEPSQSTPKLEIKCLVKVKFPYYITS